MTRDVEIHVGETLLIQIGYLNRWNSDGYIEARIIGRQAQAMATAQLKGRSSIGLVVKVPESGAKSLEIRHCTDSAVDDDREIMRAVVLAMDTSADSHELKRARTMMRWGARDRRGNTEVVLSRRRFPFAVDGCTRECGAIVPGDTMVFDVPEELGDCQFQFWVAGLTKPVGDEALLHVQVQAEEWSELTSYTLANAG